MDTIMFSGPDINNTWQQFAADLQAMGYPLSYSATLQQEGREVVISIENDPGGGFEGGYSSTRLSSRLLHPTDLHLSLHKEGLLDEAGKLFGMQDIETGFEAFDKKVIIKTNDAEKITIIFSDEKIRAALMTLNEFSLKIIHNKNENLKTDQYLELFVENDLPEISQLKILFDAFYKLLLSIDAV